MKSRAIIVRYISIAIIVTVIAVIILPISIRSQGSYVCTSTGSRYNYTQWIFRDKQKTYFESPIEKYLEQNKMKWEHKWKFIGATGYDMFGHGNFHECGSPGPMADLLPYHFDYLNSLPDAEKAKLYHTFTTANEEELEKKILQIQINAISYLDKSK